jgi:hypothetical protein
MGLSNMKAMSDNDGMQVRGMSIAIAGGWSHASFGSASSTNFYFAAGQHNASGANASVAGGAIITNHGFVAIVVGAGGFSTAHAN